MDEPPAAESWERFDHLMAQITTENEPYRLGIDALGCLSDALTRSPVVDRAYRLWGELTDRYELRPEERGATEALMRHAASEWTAAQDDAARGRYLDRWLYEVCGEAQRS